MSENITISATQLQTMMTNAIAQALAQREAKFAVQKSAIQADNIVDVATVTHSVPTRYGTGYNLFLKSGKVDRSYRVFVTPEQMAKVPIGHKVNVRPYCRKGTSVQTSVKLTLAPGINKWVKPLF